MPKLHLLILTLALCLILGAFGPVQAADPPAAPADGSVLPFPPVPSASVAGPTLQESKHQRRQEPNHLPAGAPNVLIVLLDDVGFGQPGAFGGEINTPTLSRLRNEGISYNAFHTTAICSPTRAALLDRAQPPAGRFRHHRRTRRGLGRLHRHHPQDLRHHRRGPALLRLQDRGLRQMA